nr:FKBP-type peptidylprolyl isomerase [uncultured Flavobacterium sp.]
MNKFKYFFILLITGVILVSCNKNDDDDDVKPVPLRDYTEQYNTDNANIEEYLNTYYITVVDSPGNQEDQDVAISKITDPATQPSIMSYLNSASFPKLLTRNISLNGVAYKMYYLVLREGTGTSPMNTDGVLAAYKGEYMTRVEATTTAPIVPAHLTTTLFQEIKFPQASLDLYGSVMGWSEIFPQFKTGTSTIQADGTVKYENFGAGVLFIPSGLGYYTGNSRGTVVIPPYSPLIFSFKLYDLERMDHELGLVNGVNAYVGDGVFDYQEDINGDGYVYDYRNTTLYPNASVNLDDTDKDGIPDFIDIDDDGDGYRTIVEIAKPTAEVGGSFGPSRYYPFEAFTIVDDPMTPNVNESLDSEPKGIPRRPTGELTNSKLPESSSNPRKFTEEDYIASGRLRIHLDNSYPYKKN